MSIFRKQWHNMMQSMATDTDGAPVIISSGGVGGDAGYDTQVYSPHGLTYSDQPVAQPDLNAQNVQPDNTPVQDAYATQATTRPVFSVDDAGNKIIVGTEPVLQSNVLKDVANNLGLNIGGSDLKITDDMTTIYIATAVAVIGVLALILNK